ncbi:MAG: hypothetical protein PW788_15925 [Micavibrio sp.]|nr:hypothetical protein [Micavibrio sp.]
MPRGSYKARLAVFVTAALLLFGFAIHTSAMVMVPRHALDATAYAEVVRKKATCPDGDCFVEYIFLDNGTAVRLQFKTPDYTGKADITVRRASADAAAEVLTATSAYLKDKTPPEDWDKKDNKVYAFDGTKPASFASTETPAFTALFEKAESTFNAAPPAPDFYLHSYYQPLTGDTGDFHVFADGTVIISLFAQKSDKLLATSLYTYDDAAFAALRDKAAAAAQSILKTDYKKCPADSGMQYALMEIQAEGHYAKTYFCPGSANDAAADLLQLLRSKK